MNTRFSAVVVKAFDLKLRELIETVPAITGAFLATDDGFEITQAIAGRETDPARLAAMCSSMVALSHALVQENNLGLTQNVLIEAELGKILLLSIATTPKLSLSVISKPSATLGQVLVFAKNCAEGIRKIVAFSTGNTSQAENVLS